MAVKKNIEKVIGITQASKLLGVHINTLRNWIKNKKISVITTPGGHYRILESAAGNRTQQLQVGPPVH